MKKNELSKDFEKWCKTLIKDDSLFPYCSQKMWLAYKKGIHETESRKVIALGEKGRSRVIGKDLRKPVLTEEDFEREHRILRVNMPALVGLGPFMVISSIPVHRKMTNTLTAIAFWILKKAGWKLIEGKYK